MMLETILMIMIIKDYVIEFRIEGIAQVMTEDIALGMVMILIIMIIKDCVIEFRIEGIEWVMMIGIAPDTIIYIVLGMMEDTGLVIMTEDIEVDMMEGYVQDMMEGLVMTLMMIIICMDLRKVDITDTKAPRVSVTAMDTLVVQKRVRRANTTDTMATLVVRKRVQRVNTTDMDIIAVLRRVQKASMIGMMITTIQAVGVIYGRITSVMSNGRPRSTSLLFSQVHQLSFISFTIIFFIKLINQHNLQRIPSISWTSPITNSLLRQNEFCLNHENHVRW